MGWALTWDLLTVALAVVLLWLGARYLGRRQPARLQADAAAWLRAASTAATEPGPASAVAGLWQARRHELLNDLQVVSGWLQMQRSDEAARHLGRMIDSLQNEGRALHGLPEPLALALLSGAAAAAEAGVAVGFMREGEICAAAGPAPAWQPAGLVLRDLLRTAAPEAAQGGAGQVRPRLAITVATVPAAGCRITVTAPAPLRSAAALALLPVLAERAAALGGRLAGLPGPELELWLPTPPGAGWVG